MSEHHYQGFPRPVRVALIAKPIHLRCMTGDPEKTCEECTPIILAAFDTVYGSLPSEEAVLAAIMDDLAAEEAERSPTDD